MEKKSKYTEQWERVNRWFERFKALSEGQPYSQPQQYYEDDIFAFFTNCYHLKDWIKNDPDQAEMAIKVEGFINTSVALSICGDLCNGLKHLTLNQSRSGQFATFGSKTDRISLGAGPMKISIGYLVLAGDKKYDAYDLAHQCVLDWHSFIHLNRRPA